MKKNNNTVEIVFHRETYDICDIQLAHHNISDKCMLLLDIKGDDLLVRLVCNDELIINDISKEFLYLLSQYRVRRILANENRLIRDLIVEQAFKPIANLEERVNELYNTSI